MQLTEENEMVLRYGASAGVTGVMMFITSNSVVEDTAKTYTMQKVYSEWITEK